MNLSEFLYITRHKINDIQSLTKMKILSLLLNRHKNKSIVIKKGTLLDTGGISHNEERTEMFKRMYVIRNKEQVCEVIIEFENGKESFSYSKPQSIELKKNILRIKNPRGLDIKFIFNAQILEVSTVR